MLILGLNAFHADAAACVVKDGRLIVAAEEERFRRVKHWAGFPSEAIKWCLAEVGAKLSDVDHVALNQDSRANLLRRGQYLLTSRPDVGLIIDRFRNANSIRSFEKTIGQFLASALVLVDAYRRFGLRYKASATHNENGLTFESCYN